MEYRDIASFSDEELTTIYNHSNDEAKSLCDLYVRTNFEYDAQLRLINIAFDSYSQRSGVTMTVAGLVSFLPALTNFDASYVQSFLVWTFPFLIIAVIAYRFSSVRPSAIAKQMPVFQSETLGELLILRSKCLAYQTIHRKYYEAYSKATEWFRITSMVTLIYIFSFSFNFFKFTFSNPPSFTESAVIWAVSVSLGITFVLMNILKSVKDLNFGPIIKLSPDGNAEIDSNTTTVRQKRKLKIKIDFLWYDFWVGWFYDRKNEALYICPFPMLVIKLWKE